MELFAASQADLDLGQVLIIEVHAQRDKGITFLFQFGFDLTDLPFFQ